VSVDQSVSLLPHAYARRAAMPPRHECSLGKGQVNLQSTSLAECKSCKYGEEASHYWFVLA